MVAPASSLLLSCSDSSKKDMESESGSEDNRNENGEEEDSITGFEETQVSIATRRQQRTEQWQRRRRLSPQPVRTSKRGSISLSPVRPAAAKRRESDHFDEMNASCPAIVFDANPLLHLEEAQSDPHNHPTITTTTEAMVAHMAQMVVHQQETRQALQELSSTMKALMMAQMKHEKEAEEDTKNILNVDRATVRLDGLEVYAVVSALTVATAIACFDVYNFDHNNNNHNWLNVFLDTIFLVISGIGIIAGLHATLVFSLMTMYGRTAVGVSHDEAFVEFFVQTGRVRYRGFHTFRMSLYCFLVQVLFTITSKCLPWFRPLIIGITLVCMWWVYSDTQEVIDKAGDILFNIKTPKRSTGDASKLSLERTLSSVLKPDPKRGRAMSVTEQAINAMRNQMPGPRRRRQEDQQQQRPAQQQARSQSERYLLSTNTRSSHRKGVARSKSGCAIYDVGSHESRPAVRRGGRKPGGHKES